MFKCEVFVKNYLHALRALVAKKMIEVHGYTQQEVAEKLGITQPAVSHYLREARGKRAKELEKNEKIMVLVEELVGKSTRSEFSYEDVKAFFCNACKLLLSRENVENIKK